MDIAEIRKKARNGHDSKPESVPARENASPPVAPSREEFPVQSLIAASAPAVTEIPPSSPAAPERSVAHVEAINPLDALFNWSADELLGSEQDYRQGLHLRSEDIEEDIRQWLAFTLGDEEYALEITSIREIIKLREITDIPRAPEFLLGIISLRGTIIPVFDLKNRLKLGQGEITSDSRIVVCQHKERSAGLLVDRISQVVNLPARQIEPPPAVLSGLDRELVAGVGRHQGKMMILLQLSNVLDAELY